MTEALVRRLDHVFVPVADPAPLFDLFSRELGLPVAWPLSQRGPFFSGAVGLGNANLEFIRGDVSFPFLVPTEPLTVRGLAFEPMSDHGWTEALDERGLAYVDPMPTEISTNTFLGDMLDESTITFLCRYHGPPPRASGPGLLGVRRLSEVTLGVRDLPGAMARWRRFLSPTEPDARGAFAFEGGPTVRLKRSPFEGVAGLWVEVGSLAVARDALRALDLLGPMRASGIGLDYARTGGLDVWLSERRD